MEKEFVPIEIALELKELDFDEPCFGWYTLEGDGAKPMFIFEQRLKQDIGLCLALTFSQAFRFFREKYDLHNGIYPYYDEYEFQIKDFRLPTNVPINGGIMKYEEAELACLKKLIEMVKNK
jgi:hypothetical protein